MNAKLTLLITVLFIPGFLTITGFFTSVLSVDNQDDVKKVIERSYFRLLILFLNNDFDPLL